MIRITLAEIARITKGQLFSNNEKKLVSGFSIDSRTFEQGQFFVAIRGHNFDGHDFIRDAVEKGAAGVILERSARPARHAKIDNVIIVEDTREALGMIAREIRKQVDIPVICITGTNGKTTVKDILADVLTSQYKVLRSARSYNNIVGLSLTLFDLDPSYDVAVLELGSNYPGEIAKLAGIARPHAAVITNIGDGHLEFLGTREDVFLEKTSLLGFLPEGGTAFLNREDALLAGADTGGATRKFYGEVSGCDFLIDGISRRPGGYDFSLNGDSFFVPLEGKHNVYNAAAAIAVADSFDISYENIRRVLAGVSLPKMRLEKTAVGGLMFINDSYNANPGSFMCALDVLRDSTDGTRKGVVAGDMMELGDGSDELHRMIGRSIAREKIDFLIVLGDKAGWIACGAIESGMKEQRVLRAENHEDAAEMVRQAAGPEAVVLLKGSRKAKMEEVLKCFTTSCTL